MTRKDDLSGELVCSFCGKSQDEVKKLIAGPSVYICDECVSLCSEIIQEEYGQEEKEKQKASENTLETLLLSKGTEFESRDYHEQLRQKVSEYLGINITRVIKYLEEPDPKYYLVAEEKEIPLGTVDNLIEEYKLRKHIAKGLGYYLPKQKVWRVVAQGLLDLCVEVEISPEVRELGQTERWIREFIEGSTPITIEESLTRRGAFIKDGKWNIHLPSFYSFCYL